LEFGHYQSSVQGDIKHPAVLFKLVLFGISDRDPDFRSPLFSVMTMAKAEKEKEYGMARFISSCMENKVLMGTIVVMGFLLLAAQFMPLGRPVVPSRKNLV
jgi:hypothetical protein